MPNIEKSDDGTIKLTFPEGYQAIVIPSVNDKFAVCVSCQIGCPVGCTFCYTAKLGFNRNLTHTEILNQVDEAVKIVGIPNSIIFMGMGEPMLNYENVKNSIDEIHDKYQISYKRITLSTVGINLNLLLKSEIKFRVAISLHSPNSEKRNKLIPTKTEIKEIVKFSHDYYDKKDGVMIAYTLIKDNNDTDEDLKELLNYNWAKQTNFNLIEFNDIDNLKRSDKMLEFKEAIREKGYKCFIRHSKGSDIAAACGMLDMENKN